MGAVQYASSQSGEVFVRRNTGASTFPNTNANQTIGWNAVVTAGSPNRTVAGVYANDTAAILSRSNLRSGAENTFLNSEGSGTSNNIERVDYVFSSGLTVGSQGFAVFERGQNTTGSNGAFKVVAITAVDAARTPTGLGSTVVSVTANSYGNGTLAAVVNYDVYRYNTAAGPNLDRLSDANLGPQGLSGAYIPASSLASSGATIYGYSIFASDVTATGNALLDFTNAGNFPINSTTSDMDFASVGANVYAVLEPATALGVAVLILAGLGAVRRQIAGG